MPKRADPQDAIDPVRSRLAAAAAAPVRMPADTHSSRSPTEATTATQAIAVTEARKPSAPRIMNVNRKIMVTEHEANQMHEITELVSATFGSKVTFSQVSRSLWAVLASAEDAIQSGAMRARKLKVPSKGNHVAMAEYEEALANFIAIAIKRS